jgi:hypothetical protein
MSTGVAVANLVLGFVYCSYGVITIVDLARGWRANGVSHFGLAWIAMAFTCGPHHLEHGWHVAAGRAGGPLDLAAVLIGFPAGVTWFLLRVEATAGGRGDRFVGGDPAWVRALPSVMAAYGIVMVAASAVVLSSHDVQFGPRFVPNLLLLGLYGLIGFYLMQTQLRNRAPLGGWSLSGLSLTLVFPTCGVMHAIYALYASSGRYEVDPHGLVIDWLAVPAAVYFVWVVRGLHDGSRADWNRGAHGVRRAVGADPVSSLTS